MRRRRYITKRQATRAGTGAVTVSPILSGGSSGGGALVAATLTLDDAGIRALSTTPAVIVPATTVINYNPAIVPDQIFLPVAATITTRIVAGYAVAGGTPELLIAYSSDYANDASERAPTVPTLQSIGTWQTDLPTPISLAPAAFLTNNTAQGGQPINGDWLDNALVLAARDAVITGGNAANTLALTVLYTVLRPA